MERTLIIAFIIVFQGLAFANPKTTNQLPMQQVTDSVLRHVVLFKFKSGTTTETVKKIETAFSELPSKIAEIKAYEWGLNNSPEGLDKGFTHCFFVTFENEAGRDVYLPHPDHQKFVALASPHIEDVLVVDYWTSND